MSYTPITETNVTQATTNVATRGFGTILVFDNSNYFLSRVKSYSSLEDAATELTTTSLAYKAVSAAFSVDPKPREIKIAKRQCNTVIVPSTVAGANGSTQYKVAFKVPTQDTAIVISVTGDSNPTPTEIAILLNTAINANLSLTAQFSTSLSGDAITITRVLGGEYALDVTQFTNVQHAFFPSVESEAETLAYAQSETTDFYCIASTDRTDSHISAMATLIGATKNVFTYATSSNTTYLTALTPSSTDFTGLIKNAGVKRVVHPVYVQASELDKFPEIRVFASKSSYQVGDVIYSNIVNLGILPAKTSTNTLLTNSQKGNLEARGLSYFESKNGVTCFRRGGAQGTGSTSWADETIGADFIEARINEQVQNLLFNQSSEKLGGSATSYARIESVIRTVLDSMKSTSSQARLLRKYTIKLPTEVEITSAIRAGRVATISVAAYLEGAIDSAVINVSLTY